MVLKLRFRIRGGPKKLRRYEIVACDSKKGRQTGAYVEKVNFFFLFKKLKF